MKLDLNCDLGEGEPIARTRALMRWITSANVACGGHAGTVGTMEQCTRLCQQFRVRLGAHPGSWQRADRGRGAVDLSPDELALLLLQQVSALDRIATRLKVPLHHIKLHGALYHSTEAEPKLGIRYLETVKRWWPGTILYLRAGGALAKSARQMRIPVWEEAFADRGYRADGQLVARGEPGALLRKISSVSQRVRSLLKEGTFNAIDRSPLALHPQTLCVHSDTPAAVRMVKVISRLLRARKTVSLMRNPRGRAAAQL